MFDDCSGVAQQAERQAVNLRVAGSSPAPGAIPLTQFIQINSVVPFSLYPQPSFPVYRKWLV